MRRVFNTPGSRLRIQDVRFLHEGTRIFMIESTGKDDGPAIHTPTDQTEKSQPKSCDLKKNAITLQLETLTTKNKQVLAYPQSSKAVSCANHHDAIRTGLNDRLCVTVTAENNQQIGHQCCPLLISQQPDRCNCRGLPQPFLQLHQRFLSVQRCRTCLLPLKHRCSNLGCISQVTDANLENVYSCIRKAFTISLRS